MPRFWVDVRFLAPPEEDPRALLEAVVKALEREGFRVERASAHPGSLIVTDDGTFREHVLLTDVKGRGNPAPTVESTLRGKVSNLEVKVGRADVDPDEYSDGSVEALFRGPEGDPEGRKGRRDQGGGEGRG